MPQTADIQFLPVYLIVGEDQLKRQTVVERLRKRLAQFGELSFNSDLFSGDSVDGKTIVAAANTLPFASEKRLVQVNSVEKLKKADVEAIVEYLASPSESTVLALVGEGKLNKASKLYKACQGISPKSIIDCTPFKRYELGGKVQSMARSHGVEFTPAAASTLIDLVGTNTVALDSEIRKVALAHRGADAVNENEIMALVARTAEVKPWEVVDSFSARNLARAVKLFNEYLDSLAPKGKARAGSSLLYQCNTRIRELITVIALTDRGERGNVSKKLGMPEWRVKNLFTWARSYSLDELATALIASRDVEKAMHSGADVNEAFFAWMVEAISR